MRGRPFRASTRAVRAPGLLQKYRGRALIITTSACAVHCRATASDREFPYCEQTSDAPRWSAALVRDCGRTASLEEVILSGGDPALPERRSPAEPDSARWRRSRMCAASACTYPAAHRFARAGRRWSAAVDSRREVCRTVFVLHANHPTSIDSHVRAMHVKSCVRAAVTLLNQSVLLRGVNDRRRRALAELSRGSFGVGVLPYYSACAGSRARRCAL